MSQPELLAEARRNLLLRRADWRFLLPDPRPARTRCSAGGRLATAAALVSGEVVDHRRPSAGDCDLAVASAPSPATLRASFAALRPGGACYTEWPFPVAGGAGGVRRHLEAAGFVDVTCYWPWPPALAPARVWLPLDAPTTRRAFVAAQVRPRGLARRVALVLIRGAWEAGHRLGLAIPVCATASRPLPPNECGAMPEDDLRGTIRTRWEEWGLGSAPERPAWVLLTGGPRSTSKVVGLVASESDGRPRLAVKMARVPEAAPGLEQEAATLRALHARHPGGIPGVPRVLFRRDHGGLVAVGEEALSGRPLSALVRRENYRDLALTGTDWLANLATRDPLPLGTAWRDRLVEPALAAFEENYGAAIDPASLRRTRATLIGVGALPPVCEQRDFGPWNLLLKTNGALVVLDWESAELDGLPALDLLYFLTYLAFFLDGALDSGRYRASYRSSLDPVTFTGAVRAACLARYADRVGLDGAALTALRLLVWPLHARSEHRRLEADYGGRAPLDALRRGLFIGLWEEEIRAVHGILGGGIVRIRSGLPSDDRAETPRRRDGRRSHMKGR